MNFKLDITMSQPWMLGTAPVSKQEWEEAGRERKNFLVKEFRKDWSMAFNAWLQSRDLEHFVFARMLGVPEATTRLWKAGRALPKPDIIEELEAELAKR